MPDMTHWVKQLFNHDEDTIPLKRSVCGFSTRNIEPRTAQPRYNIKHFLANGQEKLEGPIDAQALNLSGKSSAMKAVFLRQMKTFKRGGKDDG